MVLARRQGLSSVALPSIGTGVLGYPAGEAAPIIVSTVIDELAQEAVPFRVRMVLFGPAMLETYANAAAAYLRKVAAAAPARARRMSI
jgi:O-acetyl-ADP-ribose deacetylase (regulator of RNase III)